MGNRVADLQFFEDGHRYTLDGKPIASVTQVLDDCGIGDLSMVDAVTLARARDRGTRVHTACAAYAQGALEAATVTPDIAPYVESFMLFWRTAGFEPILVEAKVLSEKHGYCGRLDLFGELQQIETMIDTKTGVLGCGAGPQTSAYNEAMDESYGLRAKRRFALVLNPGKFELVPLQDQTDWQTFLAALTVAHFKTRTSK